MTSNDVALALKANGVSKSRACTAIAIMLPVLKTLNETTSGWKFWLKIAFKIVIGALEAWQKERCDS